MTTRAQLLEKQLLARYQASILKLVGWTAFSLGTEHKHVWLADRRLWVREFAEPLCRGQFGAPATRMDVVDYCPRCEAALRRLAQHIASNHARELFMQAAGKEPVPVAVGELSQALRIPTMWGDFEGPTAQQAALLEVEE